ncbi:class I SAM-dependent methyltransferase [Cohnella rhizosphaerae]|uniref:Class I SAM-dependent methyltransferase n=1 Tax=Cohnella rhizosphaerae TaxID=1457232 RepID=A0A9X4QU76_9BACL|nr:class I SAM-dependent methyltransferase [Cohnella rhizosphaerae]MDG0811184.1 class I SAM-dependent methyltransferase [Cohnella rhizosphaerae]
MEPSQKLCAAAAEKGVQVRQGYFNAASVADARPEPYDCVVVRHVLEHIDDLHDMITSLRFILKEDGVLLVEVPSLEKTVENRSYSNLFHEHLNYFSVPVLSRLFGRYGFTVDRGRFVDIHGGSILMLFRLGHASAEPIATTGGPVAAAAAADPEPVRAFAADAPRYFARVRERIASLASGGKVVHGYGASHRTFALLGGAGLDERQVPVIYDVNPFLRRKRLNGIGSLVLSADGLQQASDHPDAIVILALSYQAELVRLLRDQYGYAGDIVTLGAEVNLP